MKQCISSLWVNYLYSNIHISKMYLTLENQSILPHAKRASFHLKLGNLIFTGAEHCSSWWAAAV